MLEELDNASIEIQRRWLKFLLERVGHNNLSKLFEYYISIGWISASVAERLVSLASQEKRYTGPSWTLSPEEYRISMLYIEKLKGKQVNESLLSPPPVARRAIPERAHNTTCEKLHPVEKKKLEENIHRREVTIYNLENELEEKVAEIDKLKERIQELENLLDNCQKELKKTSIYRKILDINIRLKKMGYTLTGLK